MRWFEQAISKPRYHLMQFHRPAMLKLERLHRKGYFVRVEVQTLARFFVCRYGLDSLQHDPFLHTEDKGLCSMKEKGGTGDERKLCTERHADDAGREQKV